MELQEQAVVAEFIDPMEIFRKAGLKRGQMVADFGCGPGFFTMPAAEVVGSDGRVYAIDVLTQVLEKLANQAKTSGIHNIITKRANVEKEGGSGLGDNSIDMIVIKNMLFQNTRKDLILNEAFRVVKKDGTIIIVEWNKNNLMVGPAEELRISQGDMELMLTTAGFSISDSFDSGDFHYVIIAKK